MTKKLSYEALLIGSRVMLTDLLMQADVGKTDGIPRKQIIRRGLVAMVLSNS